MPLRLATPFSVGTGDSYREERPVLRRKPASNGTLDELGNVRKFRNWSGSMFSFYDNDRTRVSLSWLRRQVTQMTDKRFSSKVTGSSSHNFTGDLFLVDWLVGWLVFN